MSVRSETVARAGFLVSLLVIGVIYGYFARERGWFPHHLMVEAGEGLQLAREEIHETRPWYYFETGETQRCTVVDREAMAPGLTFVTYVGPDKKQFADVVDADGRLAHRWEIDWFEIWPDATHLADDIAPKSPPGAVVNGALVTDDGDLIFNFDACGLICLDPLGRVRWRRPMRSHHTLWRDDGGHIWTSLRHTRTGKRPELPNYVPPFDEYTVVELSPDGELLQEVSVFDLLRENGYEGLLFLSAQPNDHDTQMRGDTLHVNDVEVFSARLRPGFFQPGDVMVSMRTINTIAVFDLPHRRLKYLSIGHVVRQHDPDFLDGDTISIFDNRNIGGPSNGVHSRVVIESVPEGATRVAFTGRPDLPFYTNIIGRHQWLPNGNLLLVESTNGCVIEVDPRGRLLWRFANLIEPGVTGLMSDGIRLPPEMDVGFFERCRAAAQSRAEAGQDAREQPTHTTNNDPT